MESSRVDIGGAGRIILLVLVVVWNLPVISAGASGGTVHEDCPACARKASEMSCCADMELHQGADVPASSNCDDTDLDWCCLSSPCSGVVSGGQEVLPGLARLIALIADPVLLRFSGPGPESLIIHTRSIPPPWRTVDLHIRNCTYLI